MWMRVPYISRYMLILGKYISLSSVGIYCPQHGDLSQVAKQPSVIEQACDTLIRGVIQLMQSLRQLTLVILLPKFWPKFQVLH